KTRVRSGRTPAPRVPGTLDRRPGAASTGDLPSVDRHALIVSGHHEPGRQEEQRVEQCHGDGDARDPEELPTYLALRGEPSSERACADQRSGREHNERKDGRQRRAPETDP